MKLPFSWRTKLYKQALDLNIDGSLFQNEMEIDASMVSAQMDLLFEAKKDMMTQYDAHYESLRNILVEMGTKS